MLVRRAVQLTYQEFRLIAKPEEYFRRAIAETQDLEQLGEVLADLLSAGVAVWEDGSLSFIRARVDHIHGLAIEIYPLDHEPPHFHVRAPGLSAKFSLSDCEHLDGRLRGRDLQLVRWFFDSGGRDKLQAAWDRMHPVERA